MVNIGDVIQKRLEDPGGTAVSLGTSIAGNILMPGYSMIMPVVGEVAGQLLGKKVTKYFKDLIFGEDPEEARLAQEAANQAFLEKKAAHEEKWAEQLHTEYFPMGQSINAVPGTQSMTKEQIMSSGKAFQPGPGGSLVTFNGGFIPTFYNPK